MPKSTSIIDELNGIRGLEIECPKCGQPFPPRAGHLFSIKAELPPKTHKFLANKKEKLKMQLDYFLKQRKLLRMRKKEKPKQIKVTTAAVNFGKIVEKIVPSFHTFPFYPFDCRALYEPIDYIVFKNLSRSGVVDLITFAEVKSGNAVLQDNQKQIKRLVENGKVELTVTAHE